ncbi:calcium/sodium antiporter [Candidatus Woesearchaeota archaeon]|nr:calcium/sodium antiporter [Candidatus Woesearchaeota archaeon]
MVASVILIFVSLVLLIKGSDIFVENSTKIAKKLGVSEFIIGLTLAALGTSIPEFASSLSSSIQNHPDFILGNILGSNITNIGLVMGLCAFIMPFKTNKSMYVRDGYVLIFSTMIFFVFAYDGVVNRIEALSMVLIYLVYLTFLIKTRHEKATKHTFHEFLSYFFDFKYLTTIRSNIVRKAIKKKEENKTIRENKITLLFKEGLYLDIILLACSMVAVVVGARYLVSEAALLAASWGLKESYIGISLFAIGTSLPELIFGINAVRRGHGTMIAGNIIGSNIGNLMLIFAVSCIVTPVTISHNALVYTIPIMGFFSLALVYGVRQKRKLTRVKGLLGVLAYLVFIACALLYGWT